MHFKEFYELSPSQQKNLRALDKKTTPSATLRKLTSKMKEIKGGKSSAFTRAEVIKLAQVILERLPRRFFASQLMYSFTRPGKV